MDQNARDRISAHLASLDESERRALVRLFGALYDPRELPTPGLCDALRGIGSLDNDDVSWLARWFQENVNMWGVVVGDCASRERSRFAERRALAIRPAEVREPHRLGNYRKIR